MIVLHNMSKALLNTRCVAQACENLGIPYVIHDEYGNFIEVQTPEKMFFVNFTTPWNDTGSSKLCADKEFTYRLLAPHINMPTTKAFFDPHFSQKKYALYKIQSDLQQIIADIESQFKFPLIIKMNSGSKKRNVFLCDNTKKVQKALRSIYNKKSPLYDYIAVAQTYIDIREEYRVVIFRGQILIAYTKHNPIVDIVKNPQLLQKITDFITPIFTHTQVQFAGLDIAIDSSSIMFFIEMNSCPGFDSLARHHGENIVVKLYEKMLIVQ
jgi:glutathione synthase/RimK-type ligase-like ATP-grasp enzyme